jgi:hypothetical protein
MGNKVQRTIIPKYELITDAIKKEWELYILTNVQIGPIITEGNNGIVYMGTLENTSVILKELPKSKLDEDHILLFMKETKMSM